MKWRQTESEYPGDSKEIRTILRLPASKKVSDLQKDLGTSVHCHVFEKDEASSSCVARQRSEKPERGNHSGVCMAGPLSSGTSRTQRMRLTKAGRCSEMDKGHLDFHCKVSPHLRVKVVLEP